MTNDRLLFLIISSAKKDDFCEKKSDLEILKLVHCGTQQSAVVALRI